MIEKSVIYGFSNYNVNTLGEVLNIKTNRKLKPQKDGRGYLRVRLYKNGEWKVFSVHRLVGIAFINNEKGKKEINHIDEDKTNNKVCNLEWVTPKENSNYGTRNRKISKKNSGTRNHKSRSKAHYLTTATTRVNFKTSCKKQKWCFNDFKEIYSGEKYDSHKKYYYHPVK